MPKQKVPDISFEYFVFSEIKTLFDENKIFINELYQRGDIWKDSQKIELIKSIENRYSIGVLVLFKNDNNQYEILDGQQRLLTIKNYLNDHLDLGNTEIQKYSELNVRDKALLNAYCIYYLQLKSHDPDTKEEDIVQTFLRLQEGTPLNKAEKINAYRGKFKDTFREIRDTHPFFNYLGKEKRFRWRHLAAEMLLLELESDFTNKIFPSLDLPTLTNNGIKKYEKNISPKKVKLFKGNLDFLHNSLNYILTAFTPREAIPFYLLISYLRKNKADNSNLTNEFAEFAVEFLKNLNSFSIYDNEPPSEMDKTLFDDYKTFKHQSKIQTTPDSLRWRFNIILKEYNRMHPLIIKDEKRLHDVEQKRTMYFRQKGLCKECGKKMDFKISSSHHVVAHSKGGKTGDLEEAILVHEKCHKKIEKRLNKLKDK